MPILTADGKPFKSPEILNSVEMRVLERCFGLNKRGRLAHKNEYRIGVRPPTDSLVLLCNELQRRGILRLLVDGRGLSKKDFARFKGGDMSRAAIVVQVTEWGGKCFGATVKDSEDRALRARKTETSAMAKALLP